MHVLIEFLEITRYGQPKGRIVVNLDAIIDIREETVIGEIWRRVQETNDPKIAFKGIEEIAKWQKIRDAENGAGS